VLITHLAPQSFYLNGTGGARARAHYDGLPANFGADAITKLGARQTDGYVSFDVMNPTTTVTLYSSSTGSSTPVTQSTHRRPR
jgi:thioester reductase-like protein